MRDGPVAGGRASWGCVDVVVMLHDSCMWICGGLCRLRSAELLCGGHAALARWREELIAYDCCNTLAWPRKPLL